MLYNGNSISGMVGNAEMGFFSVGHTVYRYHVKSKVIDKLFTEERLTIKCQPSKGGWWQKNRWLSKRYNKAEVHKNPGAGKQEVVTLPNYNKAVVISP